MFHGLTSYSYDKSSFVILLNRLLKQSGISSYPHGLPSHIARELYAIVYHMYMHKKSIFLQLYNNENTLKFMIYLVNLY